MSSQNIIIYKFAGLYQILEELGADLTFNIAFEDREDFLNERVKNTQIFEINLF